MAGEEVSQETLDALKKALLEAVAQEIDDVLKRFLRPPVKFDLDRLAPDGFV